MKARRTEDVGTLQTGNLLVVANAAQPLDAVITPVVDLGLPLAGAFVRGTQVLPQLMARFQPHTVLASTAGGDVCFTGLLTKALWQQGSPSEAAADLPDGSRLIDPVVDIRPVERQVDDLLAEVRIVAKAGGRVLVTVLGASFTPVTTSVNSPSAIVTFGALTICSPSAACNAVVKVSRFAAIRRFYRAMVLVRLILFCN